MKDFIHWAASLEVGDRCRATIRHDTDGSKNRVNAEAIVIENHVGKSEVLVFSAGEKVAVPYNELQPFAAINSLLCHQCQSEEKSGESIYCLRCRYERIMSGY